MTAASILRFFLRRDRVLAWVAALAVGASGCAAAGGQRVPDALHGSVVDPPWPRPHVTLVTTDGRPFDFFEATKGTLTLVLFGYTNCPDVCPMHLGTIAAVKNRLTGVEANRMKVVFITTDPERDTPEVLSQWLGSIDREVIGLRGTREQVARAEDAFHLGRSTKLQDPRGTVEHAATVVAITADDSVRALYPFGTRQEDWLDDLPKLLARGKTP